MNAVSPLTSDLVLSFFEFEKKLYQTPVMLAFSIDALDFHFKYILVCYVRKDSQTTANMKHADMRRYYKQQTV